MTETSDDVIIDALTIDFNNIKYFFTTHQIQKNGVVRLCNTLYEECSVSKNNMKTFRSKKKIELLMEDIEKYKNYVDNTFQDYGV